MPADSPGAIPFFGLVTEEGEQEASDSSPTLTA